MRLEAERLWTAWKTAPEEPTSAAEEENEKAIEALEDERDAKIAAIREEYAEKLRAQWDTYNATKAATPRDKAHAEWMAYEHFGEPLLAYDDEGDERFERCALSGLIMDEEDEVLVDNETGETILKKALGVPLSEAGFFQTAA